MSGRPKTIKWQAVEQCDWDRIDGEAALVSFAPVDPNAKKIGLILSAAELRSYGRGFLQVADKLESILRRQSCAVTVGCAGCASCEPEQTAARSRIVDLAERLVAPGPKASHLSASECHEISEWVLNAVKGGAR